MRELAVTITSSLIISNDITKTYQEQAKMLSGAEQVMQSKCTKQVYTTSVQNKNG